jgi:DNA invertase Pin-like site-specific DNA recombinase
VALDDGVADGRIVHRPDRLARELHVQEVALAHAWGAGRHVRVFEAAEGAEIVRDDPRDPQRRFLRQVMGAAAELERGLIKARLQRGRSLKHHAGGYAGGNTIPFGQRIEGTGKDARRVDDPKFADLIQRIRQMRAERLTLARIAEQLNRDGIPSELGGRWHANSVKRVADRRGF